MNHIKLVYLAGPIDNVDPSVSNRGRRLAEEMLNRHGVGCFNPRTAWSLPPFSTEVTMSEIFRANLNVLEQCDAVLVDFSTSTDSIGSVLEIARANAKNIPVFIACPEHHKRMALHDFTCFDTVEQVCKAIVEMLDY